MIASPVTQRQTKRLSDKQTLKERRRSLTNENRLQFEPVNSSASRKQNASPREESVANTPNGDPRSTQRSIKQKKIDDEGSFRHSDVDFLRSSSPYAVETLPINRGRHVKPSPQEFDSGSLKLQSPLRTGGTRTRESNSFLQQQQPPPKPDKVRCVRLRREHPGEPIGITVAMRTPSPPAASSTMESAAPNSHGGAVAIQRILAGSLADREGNAGVSLCVFVNEGGGSKSFDLYVALSRTSITKASNGSRVAMWKRIPT